MRFSVILMPNKSEGEIKVDLILFFFLHSKSFWDFINPSFIEHFRSLCEAISNNFHVGFSTFDGERRKTDIQDDNDKHPGVEKKNMQRVNRLVHQSHLLSRNADDL